MGDERDELNDAEAEALAARVLAGQETVAAPAELTEETAEPTTDPVKAKSLYAQVLAMTMGDKIKLALRGNKDARNLLIRDSNKMVRRFVLLNPRMTDAEVIAVARTRNADEEMLRTITERREWMRNYQVKLALVTNPKTPLPVAMRQLGTLAERDIRTLAKSKNVPEAVAAQARRILFARREHSGS